MTVLREIIESEAKKWYFLEEIRRSKQQYRRKKVYVFCKNIYVKLLKIRESLVTNCGALLTFRMCINIHQAIKKLSHKTN